MAHSFSDKLAAPPWQIADAKGLAKRAVGSARASFEQGAERVKATAIAASPWPQTQGYASPWASSAPAANLAQQVLPPLEVRLCSWNLHGKTIAAADDISSWLAPADQDADIYVVGVQELVELNAKSFIMNASGDDERLALLERQVTEKLRRIGTFVKVCSFGMVGLALLVYIRQDLASYVFDVDCDRVKTGLDGIGGNKGCVCARLQVADVSLCFVNVHLASGQGASAERNQNLSQILADAFQSTSSLRGSKRPSKQQFQRQSKHTIARHHFVAILGDFNSRLDVGKEENWPQEPQNQWLRKDQVLLGLMPCLRGFKEGPIAFPPTYKYKIGTNAFNTHRCPAWCDRIFFKCADDVDALLYDYKSFPDMSHTSDHRPVSAQFTVTSRKTKDYLAQNRFAAQAGHTQAALPDALDSKVTHSWEQPKPLQHHDGFANDDMPSPPSTSGAQATLSSTWPTSPVTPASAQSAGLAAMPSTSDFAWPSTQGQQQPHQSGAESPWPTPKAEPPVQSIGTQPAWPTSTAASPAQSSRTQPAWPTQTPQQPVQSSVASSPWPVPKPQELQAHTTSAGAGTPRPTNGGEASSVAWPTSPATPASPAPGGGAWPAMQATSPSSAPWPSGGGASSQPSSLASQAARPLPGSHMSQPPPSQSAPWPAPASSCGATAASQPSFHLPSEAVARTDSSVSAASPWPSTTSSPAGAQHEEKAAPATAWPPAPAQSVAGLPSSPWPTNPAFPATPGMQEGGKWP
eukprot:TRINITY_DN34741_c0_g1_i1.p1 TRINITY_DN34741_c0_g1~~TRINITY_DN34741_c0_g1_i1.p1  ORF type:complete len:748 (-),score=95.60 TRINITY_DN34741_c0_g1_i1:70-2313(-)